MVYPEYKANRRKDLTEEERDDLKEYYYQMNLLRYQVLPEMGFGNLWGQVGLESDDIMAKAVSRWSDLRYRTIFLLTNDQDLYQCLDHTVIMVNPWAKDKKTRWYTGLDFRHEYYISTKQWGEVKSMAGCLGDDVQGIENVGPKTAIKYLNGTLKEGSKTYQAIQSPEGMAITKRNRGLVILPHEKTKPPKLRANMLTLKKIQTVLENLGMFETWERTRLDWIQIVNQDSLI